jgi:hypothetical protein
MIEVTIWWGNKNGDSASVYIVDRDTSNKHFDTPSWIRAARCAFQEFNAEQPECCIYRIELKKTGTKVLEP